MFARTRHTLRAGKQRRTLKQRGGGTTLIGFCSWRTDKRAALEVWQTVITDSSPFVFLLTGDLITEEQYITIVQQQDNLFMLAIDIIYNTLGAKKGDEADIIKKVKEFKGDQAQLTTYIKDVISIVQLEIDFSKFNGTKFDKLLKLDNEPLLHLLINPQRVKNQFVENMAQFIIVMKKTNMLENIKDNNDLISLLSIRYDSVMKANALATTSIDLRDGPNLVFSTGDITTMFGTNISNKANMFMYQFLLRCANKYYDGTKINESTPDSIIKVWSIRGLSEKDRYAIISAFVYNVYKNNTGDVINYFKGIMIDGQSIVGKYKNTDFNINTMRYIIHLANKINEYENSLTLSVEPPSSQENAASSTQTVQ
jgi:hypothetical protein